MNPLTNVWLLLAETGCGFLFLALLFGPLEKAFPARRDQKILRPDWLLDLCFFLGQKLVWTGLVLMLLESVSSHLQQLIPATFRTAVASQPWWLQVIEVVVLSDVLIYWGHRLQHRVEWLWRFHSVHHTAEHMDWLAAHREHPLDTVYTVGLINLPAFVLGFPTHTIVGLIAFRGLWAIFIHSNVRLPIGPIRMLIGAPELHHWHHDKARDAGNYANLSPLMDLLFGTYICPDHEPQAFGISQAHPRTYWGLLLHPFLPHQPEQTNQSPSTRDVESAAA